MRRSKYRLTMGSSPSRQKCFAGWNSGVQGGREANRRPFHARSGFSVPAGIIERQGDGASWICAGLAGEQCRQALDDRLGDAVAEASATRNRSRRPPPASSVPGPRKPDRLVVQRRARVLIRTRPPARFLDARMVDDVSLVRLRKTMPRLDP